MLKKKRYVPPLFQKLIHSMKKLSYVSVKKLSTLLPRITSKHDGDFYCFIYLQTLRTKSKLTFLKRVCENKDFYDVVIPSEKSQVSENLRRYHPLFIKILSL